MEARQVKTTADAREIVGARGLSHVKIGVTDIDGIIRGKYMARDKFFSALEFGRQILRRDLWLGFERSAL